MIVKDCWRGSLTLPGSVTVFSPKTPPTFRRIYLLSENKKIVLVMNSKYKLGILEIAR